MMSAQTQRQERWYRTVWRWHFYAGLFTVPFIIWLSLTGGIYLFKPQIEALLDRPYLGLAAPDAALPPNRLVEAAQAVVPGSVLHRYVLSQSPGDARQIVVGIGADETRVYVQPATGEVLKAVPEEDRLMPIVSRLHGELMIGRWGSTLVELAASWSIVMLLTGLFLWWPRGTERVAGVLIPRFLKGRRIFWRDLHAVTGVWVSFGSLFLILSGLPWAENWGEYLRTVRAITQTEVIGQDWSKGSEADAVDRAQLDASMRTTIELHAEHRGRMSNMPAGLAPLDRIVPTATSLHLPGPVEISPPADGSERWRVVSNTANRPQRAVVEVDGQSGAVVGREDFADRHWIDRAVGYGIAVHEGAYFGFANQLLNLAVLMGLITLAISSIVVWWRRRPPGALGAPPSQGLVRHNWLLVLATIVLAFLVPLFGISLAIVFLAEKSGLCRGILLRFGVAQ